VGGEVLGAAVGLHLDQPAPAQLAGDVADDELADEVLRDLEGRPSEEVEREGPGG